MRARSCADLFGLQMSSVPSEFIPKMQALVAAASTWSPLATALGVGSLVFLVISAASRKPRARVHPRPCPRRPHSPR
ncbi:MAG: hypothetical protein QM736_20095 [Vicinamibacterales bacterium]